MAEVKYGGVVDASGEPVPRQVLVAPARCPGRAACFSTRARESRRPTRRSARPRTILCLESGCAIDQAAGEVCLQPLLRAGRDYDAACSGQWVKLVESP